jgi:hypothetical protein
MAKDIYQKAKYVPGRKKGYHTEMKGDKNVRNTKKERVAAH